MDRAAVSCSQCNGYGFLRRGTLLLLPGSLRHAQSGRTFFPVALSLRDRSPARSRHARPATKTGALVVTVAVAMAVCAAPWVSLQAPTASASPVATPGTSSVRDVALPISKANDYSGSLGVLDGHIVAGDNAGGTACWLAIVQPATLTVLSDQATSCNDRRLLGEHVMPVESLPSVGSPDGVLRISVRDEATGAIHVGPVVMRYENCSDCRPEWGDQTPVRTWSWKPRVRQPAAALQLRTEITVWSHDVRFGPRRPVYPPDRKALLGRSELANPRHESTSVETAET